MRVRPSSTPTPDWLDPTRFHSLTPRKCVVSDCSSRLESSYRRSVSRNRRCRGEPRGPLKRLEGRDGVMTHRNIILDMSIGPAEEQDALAAIAERLVTG